MKPTIVLGTDHAGFELKEHIKDFLVKKGYTVEDKGALSYDAQDDYPEFMFAVAKEIAKHPSKRGVIFGGSGQGEAMAANRINGARAALYYGAKPDIIELSRTHNDANILSLGARFVSKEEAQKVITQWLALPSPKEDRHKRRIRQLDSA